MDERFLLSYDTILEEIQYNVFQELTAFNEFLVPRLHLFDLYVPINKNDDCYQQYEIECTMGQRNIYGSFNKSCCSSFDKVSEKTQPNVHNEPSKQIIENKPTQRMRKRIRSNKRTEKHRERRNPMQSAQKEVTKEWPVKKLVEVGPTKILGENVSNKILEAPVEKMVGVGSTKILGENMSNKMLEAPVNKWLEGGPVKKMIEVEPSMKMVEVGPTKILGEKVSNKMLEAPVNKWLEGGPVKKMIEVVPSMKMVEVGPTKILGENMSNKMLEAPVNKWLEVETIEVVNKYFEGKSINNLHRVEPEEGPARNLSEEGTANMLVEKEPIHAIEKPCHIPTKWWLYGAPKHILEHVCRVGNAVVIDKIAAYDLLNWNTIVTFDSNSYYCACCEELFKSLHEVYIHINSNVTEQGHFHNLSLCTMQDGICSYSVVRKVKSGMYNCAVCGVIYTDKLKNLHSTVDNHHENLSAIFHRAQEIKTIIMKMHSHQENLLSVEYFQNFSNILDFI